MVSKVIMCFTVYLHFVNFFKDRENKPVFKLLGHCPPVNHQKKKYTYIYCITKSSFRVKCEILLIFSTSCNPVAFDQMIQMYV